MDSPQGTIASSSVSIKPRDNHSPKCHTARAEGVSAMVATSPSISCFSNTYELTPRDDFPVAIQLIVSTRATHASSLRVHRAHLGRRTWFRCRPSAGSSAHRSATASVLLVLRWLALSNVRMRWPKTRVLFPPRRSLRMLTRHRRKQEPGMKALRLLALASFVVAIAASVACIVPTTGPRGRTHVRGYYRSNGTYVHSHSRRR